MEEVYGLWYEFEPVFHLLTASECGLDGLGIKPRKTEWVC